MGDHEELLLLMMMGHRARSDIPNLHVTHFLQHVLQYRPQHLHLQELVPWQNEREMNVKLTSLWSKWARNVDFDVADADEALGPRGIDNDIGEAAKEAN